MASSNASSICRIDWRPSRALSASLIGLGALAGVSILLSDLDARLAWPAALLCVACGLGWARNEARRTPVRVVWSGSGEPALIESVDTRRELTAVSLHLRGPLAVLAGCDRDGRSLRFVFYPDTLDGAGRRALRLAASGSPSTADTLAVALS